MFKQIKFNFRFFLMLFLVFGVVCGGVFGGESISTIKENSNPLPTLVDNSGSFVYSNVKVEYTKENQKYTYTFKDKKEWIEFMQSKKGIYDANQAKYTTSDGKDFIPGLMDETFTNLKNSYINDIKDAELNLKNCQKDCSSKQKNYNDALAVANSFKEYGGVQSFLSDLQNSGLSPDEKAKILNCANNPSSCSNEKTAWYNFWSGWVSEDKLTQQSVVEYGKQIDSLKFQYDSCVASKGSNCLEDYNNKLGVQIKSNVNSEILKNAIGTNCDNGASTTCYDAIQSTNCKTDKICIQEKQNALAQADLGQKKTEVQTNGLYDVLSILANPDTNALKASKLFKLDEKFNLKDTTLYSIFGDSIPSKICLAKIDGYLDTEMNNQLGGVSRYTVDYVDPDRHSGEITGLRAAYDLRAQRTATTPDMKTVISYSYYISSPKSGEVKYKVYIEYQADGKVKEMTLDEGDLTKGAIAKNFATKEYFLNSTKVDENSFTMILETSGSETYNVDYPVILISGGGNY